MEPEPRPFFSCDWGTTSFRLSLVDTASGKPAAQSSAGRGIRELAASLPADADIETRGNVFAAELAGALEQLQREGVRWEPNTPVVISGMASSSLGWKELPYAPLPFAVNGSSAMGEWIQVSLREGHLPVLLVSGTAGPTEMMRGEETQLIGLLSLSEFRDLGDDCLVILPGTHSKHIRVRDGNVTELQTYMTGELFDILCRHSVLRFTTSSDDRELDEAAFREGIRAACEAGPLRMLFQARTRSVLGRRTGRENRSFLSGLLIGSELEELKRAAGSVPILLASGSIGSAYEMAARETGLNDRMRLARSDSLSEALVRGHALLLKQFEQ